MGYNMSGILTNSASGDSSMPMIKQGLRIISTRQKAAASEEFFEITAGGGSLLMGVSFPVKAVLKKNNEISITFEQVDYAQEFRSMIDDKVYFDACVSQVFEESSKNTVLHLRHAWIHVLSSPNGLNRARICYAWCD